jgi:hypothetical protein
MNYTRYVVCIKKDFVPLQWLYHKSKTQNFAKWASCFANILDLFLFRLANVHKKVFPSKLPKDKLYYRYVSFTSLIFVDKTVGLNVIFPPMRHGIIWIFRNTVRQRKFFHLLYLPYPIFRLFSLTSHLPSPTFPKYLIISRVSFETSFDSKQPKLEPKLFFFSAPSEKNVCGCFGSILKQRVSVFQLNQNKQKSNWNSFIESIFWYFSENLRLFRFVSICFETVLFVSVVRYRFKTPKQIETNQKFFVFGFTKQSKHNTNRSCFGLFWF